jgi:hypothetical protein
VFRSTPELLVAASVPVLLVAAVLPWQQDVICARAGCGTVSASAWSGSAVWALVVLAALAVSGAWILTLPTRTRVSRAVAALTGVVGVLGAVLVLISVLALVTNRAAFFAFDLPVRETFPVLSVHPGAGLYLALPALALPALAAWSTLHADTRQPARRSARLGNRAGAEDSVAAFGHGGLPPRHRHRR